MSSYRKPVIPLIVDPVGVDKVIQAMQKSLASGLPWLEKSFGRAFTGSEMREGRNYYYPEVYEGSGEYHSVLPNDSVKAQSFFLTKDPAKILDYEFYQPGITMEYPIAVIFWFNLEEIKREMSYSYSHRFNEELKLQVLSILKNQTSFTIQTIAETPEEIFKGWSINHVKEQELKHPFGGFRFDGILNFSEC